MKYPHIYIDADGVERGYYVYAHRCLKLGEIFYVGKGKEDRAWNDKRSNAWKEYVESIDGQYEVLLLHRDLTEDEAIDLEREEIAANGGAKAEGGRLVNWIPGEAGEGFGVAIKVEVSLGGDQDPGTELANLECIRLYNEARGFKKLARPEIASLGQGYELAVKEAIEPIERVYWETFDSEKREASFLITIAYQHHQEIKRLCRQIKNRKMKWSDFCEEVDSEITSLERSVYKESTRNEATERDLGLCRAFSEAQVRWSAVYANGSFSDAQRASDRHWIAFRFPKNQQYDGDFEKYVAYTRVFFGDERANSCVSIRDSLGKD